MKKIGIIGAMELEVAKLKDEMKIEQIVEKASMHFYEGTLKDKNVVVVQCGVGKVNAGICVQILCDYFHVTNIINTGVAGSLNDELEIGDFVIGTEAVYHDVDVTPWGYKPGQVPGIDVRFFPADGDMISIAKSCCDKMNSEISYRCGRIASGDQFVNSKELKKKIVDEFGPFCTEMEGSAIAHAAYLNKIPFIIIRVMSDKANGLHEIDFVTFEKEAATRCASFVVDFVNAL